MNYRVTTILLAAALLLVLGISATQAAPPDPPIPEGSEAAPAGQYHFTNHGTAWVAENRSQFSAFQPKGWGTITKVKTAGNWWVHIPVPYPSYVADSPMNIIYVEFCAQSTNGANTKPIQMDLWEGNTNQFLSVGITWWADNAYHCWGYNFSTPTWRQDLGVSVLLHFANTTDKITLYKAWVAVEP